MRRADLGGDRRQMRCRMSVCVAVWYKVTAKGLSGCLQGYVTSILIAMLPSGAALVRSYL